MNDCPILAVAACEIGLEKLLDTPVFSTMAEPVLSEPLRRSNTNLALASIGVLYPENNLSSHVFARNRIAGRDLSGEFTPVRPG